MCVATMQCVEERPVQGDVMFGVAESDQYQQRRTGVEVGHLAGTLLTGFRCISFAERAADAGTTVVFEEGGHQHGGLTQGYSWLALRHVAAARTMWVVCFGTRYGCQT
jgi:hypothetical protein